jgi:type IV pilus assembly protein PilM
VAAVVLNTVLEEYESAFRDAGYNPGMVMPSMLAALGAADAERPTLVVKVDARTISIAILDQEQLLLFRTLENVRGVTITGDQLAEEVYPSVVFFPGHLQPEHRARVCGGPAGSGWRRAGAEESVGRGG